MSEIKIIKNLAKCKLCGDIVESKYTHDFRQCSCGALCVDGGHSYLKRSGDSANYIEMSEYENIKE